MKLKLSTAVLLFIFVCQSVLLVGVRWHNEGWKKVIEYDGKGYYDFLPATFIKHNLGDQDPFQEFVRPAGKRIVNKYYIGTSLMMSPFFAGAWIYTSAMNEVSDGYTLPYQVAISLAGLFYLLVGLWLLKKILESLGIKDPIIALVLFLITYSTNLLHYSLMEPGMSHVYSFATVCLFLYTGIYCFIRNKTSLLLLCAASFAVIVLIRPVNGVVIFLLPFMAGSKNLFWDLFRKKRMVLGSLLLILGILSLQLWVWYWQSGQWLIWSYPGEGFYFFHPEILNVLFSYKKGLFLYTPLALLSLAGLIPLYRINRFAFGSLLITLALATWAIASWWSWSYAGSYSQRAFVEYLPLFAILLAFLLNFSPKLRPVLLTCCGLFLALNAVQYYQFHHEILDPNYMNKGKYWYIFLKTSPEYTRCLGGVQDDRPYSKEPPVLLASLTKIFAKEDKGNLPTFLEGKKGEYAPGLEITGSPALTLASRIYLEISLSRYEQVPNASSDAILLLEVKGETDKTKYSYFVRLNDYPAADCCQWRTYDYTLDIPALQFAGDHIHFSIQDPASTKFCIGQFRAKLWGIRQ